MKERRRKGERIGDIRGGEERRGGAEGEDKREDERK